MKKTFTLHLLQEIYCSVKFFLLYFNNNNIYTLLTTLLSCQAHTREHQQQYLQMTGCANKSILLKKEACLFSQFTY